MVRPGDDAFIHCSVVGDQPITIEWLPVGRLMPISARVNGGYLHFNRIHISDAGKYRCTARNDAGEADGVAEVVVQGIVYGGVGNYHLNMLSALRECR